MDNVRGGAAAEPGTPEFARRFALRQAELIRRLADEPRISRVTFSAAAIGDERGGTIATEAAADTSGHPVRFNQVSVNFFSALGVPILAGRGFEAGDATPTGDRQSRRAEGGAVVVNQSFAEQIFAGHALGRRIRYEGGSGLVAEPGRWYEIVGIVKDFPAGVSPSMNDSPLRVYHPAAVGQLVPVTLALRVRAGAPASFARRLSEIAAALDPDLQLKHVISLDEALRKEQWLRRLEAAVLGSISLCVLLLSSAGIYALMAFTVAQRRKEIGIRMALGADRTRLVLSIFSRALAQLAAGAAVGVALAAAFEKASGGELLKGNGGVVLPGVAAFMMSVGFLATLVPARRCLGIEPTEALREQ